MLNIDNMLMIMRYLYQYWWYRIELSEKKKKRNFKTKFFQEKQEYIDVILSQKGGIKFIESEKNLKIIIGKTEYIYEIQNRFYNTSVKIPK